MRNIEFLDYEIDTLKAHGFEERTLGQEIVGKAFIHTSKLIVIVKSRYESLMPTNMYCLYGTHDSTNIQLERKHKIIELDNLTFAIAQVELIASLFHYQKDNIWLILQQKETIHLKVERTLTQILFINTCRFNNDKGVPIRRYYHVFGEYYIDYNENSCEYVLYKCIGEHNVVSCTQADLKLTSIVEYIKTEEI